MLKFLLIVMVFLAITMGVKVNLKRTYFSIYTTDVSARKNSYIRGPAGEINGSEPIEIKWIGEIASWNQERLQPGFEIHYHGKHPKQFTGFGPCKSYSKTSIIDLAQDFFNKLLTNTSRKLQCPLYRDVKVQTPGHLEYNHPRTSGIFCNTSVEVVLWLKEQYYKFNSWGQQTLTEFEFFTAKFAGEFTDC